MPAVRVDAAPRDVPHASQQGHLSLGMTTSNGHNSKGTAMPSLPTPIAGRLADKNIIVAGGGFVGRALASRYASEGANVVIGDIRLAAAQEIADAISQEGGTALAVELDGTNERSVAAMITQCDDAFGGLDGIHLNFASFADNDPAAGIVELPLEKYDQTMEINAKGYVLCTRHAVPAILRRGGGAIVYTSSTEVYVGAPIRCAYSMSKSAVNALMRHVASRYGKEGIRANCIAPGLVLNMRAPGQFDHPSFGQVPAEYIKDILDGQLISSRVATPRDIAAAGALLLSDEGSFITGQVLNVDGGATLRA